MNNIIEVKNLYKIFDDSNESVALTDINLAIKEGEYIAITGPNGSGKTTLLYCFGGYIQPTSGSIHIRDKDITSIDQNELASIKNKTIGFIFQNLEILEFLTVKENLEVPLIIADENRKTIDDKINKYSKLLNLEKILDKKCSDLSGGQKQKVAVTVALMNEPSIIFADEPTSNLDKETRKVVSDLLKQLNNEGKTIVLVSHDDELLNNVDRKIKLDKSYLISKDD